MLIRIAPLLLAGALLAPLTHAVCGDCNGDGVVDILDALTGAQHSAGLLVLVPPQLDDCDVDSSSDVSVLDALLIAQLAAGLPVMLQCLPSNLPPLLTLVFFPPQDNGIVPFYYQVADAESDQANVFFEYSTDSGVSWRSMTAQAGLTLTSPTSGLPTSPTGVDQLFLWDAWLDAPAISSATQVRAWADDGAAGPVASGVVDLTNGAVASNFVTEAIPTRYRWSSGSNIEFYVVGKNLTASTIMLQFPSSCQYEWDWDAGAWSSGTFFVCLAVLTTRDLPPSGVYEWPLVIHEPIFYGLPPGTHDLRTIIVPLSGDVESTPIEIVVR